MVTIKTITVKEFVEGKQEAKKRNKKLGETGCRLANMKKGECAAFVSESEEEFKRSYNTIRAYILRHSGKHSKMYEIACNKEQKIVYVMRREE